MSTKHVFSKLSAAGAFVLSGVAAQAGGYVAPTPDPIIVAPMQEEVPAGWEGGYAGIALGYSVNGDDRVGVFNRAFGDPNFTYDGDIGTIRPKGAILSLRGGYRWERGNWVFGPELEVHGGNVKDSISTTISDSSGSGTATATFKEKYGVSLRMKTGYQVRPDTIIYGIAGVARGKFDYDLAEKGVYDGKPVDTKLNSSFSSAGYVIGLGAERKLNQRLSLTGDVEYYNYGKAKIVWTDADGDSVMTNATPDYWTLKVGLNYQF